MFILKIILIICILEITTKIGFILSSRFNKSLNEYMIIEDILNYMESKIKYSQDDLICVFDDISKQYENKNFGTLFLNISNDLKQKDIPLYDTVKLNIEKLSYMFSCNLNIIEEAAKNLGKSDIENQIKNICLSKERVKVLIKDAKNKKDKNEKLYRNLGIITGLIISIILI